MRAELEDGSKRAPRLQRYPSHAMCVSIRTVRDVSKILFFDIE